MASDDEKILKAAAEGRSIREIARAYRIDEDAVRNVLDREAEAWFDAAHLRRELLLEVTRLNTLAQKYYGRAMDDDEGSTAAGLLFTKLSERKAALIGLKAPASASVQIIHQGAPAWEQTGTEKKNRSALDNVMGVTAREIELEDKRDNESMTSDEWAEFDQLRAERKARIDAKRAADREAERQRIFRLGQDPGKPH